MNWRVNTFLFPEYLGSWDKAWSLVPSRRKMLPQWFHSLMVLLNHSLGQSRAVVLNLCYDTFRVKWPFHGCYLTKTIVTTHNNRKSQLGINNKIILWLGGVTTTHGTILKGCSISKVENHWSGGGGRRTAVISRPATRGKTGNSTVSQAMVNKAGPLLPLSGNSTAYCLLPTIPYFPSHSSCPFTTRDP